MTASASITVVGGGVFGVTAALELRRRGHAVTLFDPGPLPHPRAASTDVSKMVRMDYGADEVYTALMETAFEGWERWNRELGETLYHEDGFLILSVGEMRPGGFEYDSFVHLKRRGHALERLNSNRLKRRFPAWVAERYQDGYFNPRAGWAASGRVVARLVEVARREGVVLGEGQEFGRLLERGSRVAGIVTADGREHGADFVLVAAGAWTPTLLPYLGDRMWATGQPVFHLRPSDAADYRSPRFPPWAADISRTGWYGFPAQEDGTLKIANHGPGRRVHPDDPREVTAEDVDRLREFLGHTFPGLVDAPLISTRLCLYCDSWDGSFYIDHDPDRPGLLVAAGDSGHGFKFAPVLGGIVADVLERKPNPWAARFAWRPGGNVRAENARFTGDA
jgi:glycine/D-amino acid oxidase-like deaminating enzyme